MTRQEFFDGTEVGPGYCRALRAGNFVFVSGTGSANQDGTVVGEDVYEQTREIYRKIDAALQQVGASLRDVVRVCVYVIDIGEAASFMKAHAEAFGAASPTATLVQVSALVKGFQVEIEAQAAV